MWVGCNGIAYELNRVQSLLQGGAAGTGFFSQFYVIVTLALTSVLEYLFL